MAKRVSTDGSSLHRFDTMQQDRYGVAGGKDGDGDPAFTRDVLALQRDGRNAMTTLIPQQDGRLRYKHNNGD